MATKSAKDTNEQDAVSSKKESSGDGSAPEFGIQRIYAKDISFESKAPEIFRKEWNPNVNVDLQSKSQHLGESIYEVVLHITVTVKTNDEQAFLIEVHKAGIFTIKNFSEEQLQHTLGSFCPTVIFPYAREVITDLVAKGGFPQLYLAPINFDAIYQQQLRQRAESSEQSGHSEH